MNVLIVLFLLLLLTACSPKTRIAKEVVYVDKKPPESLLEACTTPLMGVRTYRESLQTLSKYKLSLKMCGGKVKAIREYYE